MTAAPLKIPRIDSREIDVAKALAELRERLSPRGNVVSEAGRRRTIEVFGEPLSPAQVVERICHDVRAQGSGGRARLFGPDRSGPADAADDPRAGRGSGRGASARPIRNFWPTVRRIRDNILRIPTAILQHDVTRRSARRRLSAAALSAAAAGRHLRAGRRGGLSVDRADDRRAGPGGGSEATGGRRSADSVWRLQRRSAGHLPRVGRRAKSIAMGGAQAVAALAYGVEGIPPVDKIVGPGNLFVALAKKFVFGEVDIDSIAGPSEVVVIADDSTRADFSAADLIAQAEHAPGASVLITWSPGLLERRGRRIGPAIGRSGARRSGPAEPGAIRSADPGPIGRRGGGPGRRDRPRAFAHRHGRRRAAAGEDSARRGGVSGALTARWPLGDYAAGPSHVLPTGGTARFASGLSANDFLRSRQRDRVHASGLAAVADDIRTWPKRKG